MTFAGQLGARPGSHVFHANIPDDRLEIDATANQFDALFNEVISDTAHLLVSVTGDPGGIAVHSHRRTTGDVAVWATHADVDTSGHLEDLDALEVWGLDFLDDSDRISLEGDPGGASVFECTLGVVPTCTAHPIVTTGTIAGLVAGLLGTSAPIPETLIDLDALMWREGGDDATAGFNDDALLFSLRPIDTILNGGEVFVWDIGAGTFGFLTQGGHVWDTAHADGHVLSTMGHRNVDALEAVATVPLPASTALVGAGLLALGWSRRRTA